MRSGFRSRNGHFAMPVGIAIGTLRQATPPERAKPERAKHTRTMLVLRRPMKIHCGRHSAA
jgi:hypothetical protein